MYSTSLEVYKVVIYNQVIYIDVAAVTVVKLIVSTTLAVANHDDLEEDLLLWLHRKLWGETEECGTHQ